MGCGTILQTHRIGASYACIVSKWLSKDLQMDKSEEKCAVEEYRKHMQRFKRKQGRIKSKSS